MACRFGGVALAALLLLPLATAASGHGDLTTAGAASFPAGTASTFNPLAFFVANTTGFSGTLTAPLLRVWTYERTDVSADPGLAPEIHAQEPGLKETSYVLHDVNATFSAGSGIFGLYPGEDASLAFTSSSDQSTDPQSVSVIPAGYPYSTDSPDLPFYNVQMTTPHLDLTAPGIAQYVGPGAAKPIGPLVRLAARENTTTIQTGGEQTSPVELTRRWVYLEWDAGSLSITTGKPAQMAGSEVPSFSLDGTLALTPTRGELDTDHARYVADGSAASIAGRLSGSMAPTSDGSAARLILSGDVRSSSMRAESVRAPLGPQVAGLDVPWLALTIAGLAFAGGTAAFLARPRLARAARSRRAARERAPPDPGFAAILAAETGEPAPDAPRSVRAENDVERAGLAALQHEWPTALHYLDRAAEGDPRCLGDALHEKGIILRHLGRFREAREAFENAAAYRDDGESEMQAARCCLVTSAPEDAEALILRALAYLAPDVEMVKQVATEASFAALRERPPVRAALEQACARLNLSGP